VKGQLIYGKNPVREFIRTARAPVSGRLLYCRESGDRDGVVAAAVALGLVPVESPRRDLDARFPGAVHQGYAIELDAEAGEVAAGEYVWEIELADAVGRGERPRVLLLDRVQDPGNLGAIVRTAAQFGVACIFVPRDRAAAFTAVARKAACGGDRYVPVIQVTNLAQQLAALKEMGFWTAAACGEEGKAVWDFRFDVPFAVVLGAEGDGVRRLLVDRCDWKLRIPMLPRLDSLNVSVSAGIVLYEMFRQNSSENIPH